MKLYNTLTRTVQDFTPLTGNQARVYSCGPTVYNHAHIGNLSAYIFADTLRRVVGLATGASPVHVMNYTDIDDKTIRYSQQQYPAMAPSEALRKLTDHYIELFLADMRSIGNDVEAFSFVRATDRIAGMKELITKLHQAGFAYIADDGVYFSIEAYQKSGKTYGQLLEITTQNTSAARIQNDEYDKDSVHDFALWKKQKPGEPSWKFTLDDQDITGRPGWHIECSVMSHQELGQPFDIHTGGVDLIFPHHENEIAQSTALTPNPVMAQIFAHNEHILVDGKKMAKSANNFVTLQDIIDRGYDPLAFRLLVLQAHYRSQVHFSWESLQASQNALTNFCAWADLGLQGLSSTRLKDNYTGGGKAIDLLKQAMLDDLKTPEALAHFNGMVKRVEELGVDSAAIAETATVADNLFGLGLGQRTDISAEQKQLIAAREQARATQEWARSDDLRNQLASAGIGLRDTAQGAVWYRF